eukprot:m51a1_g9362 putative leucine zipper transcription factor-like protein 1 (1023) ;mRNA; f:161713-168337
MSEGTITEFHGEQLSGYLRFASMKRSEALVSVDVAFNEALDAKLTDEDKLFTADELRELVNGVRKVIKGDVQHELLHTSHVSALVLRQLFTQAEDILLDLHVDTTQLENQFLLQEMSAFDEAREKGSSKLKALSKVSASAAVQHALKTKGSLEERLHALQVQLNTVAKEKAALEQEVAALRASGAKAAPVAASHAPSAPAKGSSPAPKTGKAEPAAKGEAHAAQAGAAPAVSAAAAAAAPGAGGPATAPAMQSTFSEEPAGQQQTASVSAGSSAARQQVAATGVVQAPGQHASASAAPAVAGVTAQGNPQALAAVEQLKTEIERLRQEIEAERANARAEHEKASRAQADLTKKVQVTTPFLNLRKMLKAKNDSVKQLRDLLKNVCVTAFRLAVALARLPRALGALRRFRRPQTPPAKTAPRNALDPRFPSSYDFNVAHLSTPGTLSFALHSCLLAELSNEEGSTIEQQAAGWGFDAVSLVGRRNRPDAFVAGCSRLGLFVVAFSGRWLPFPPRASRLTPLDPRGGIAGEIDSALWSRLARKDGGSSLFTRLLGALTAVGCLKKPHTPRVVITGHSDGAACFAVMLARESLAPEVLSVYTFGQRRVGDAELVHRPTPEEVDLDVEVLDVNHLKTFLMSQLGITYRARDIFLVLPEGVDPELMAHISKDTGVLDLQKELVPDFFKLLGKGILKVRVKTGAVPLATQPPVSTSPPPGTCVLSGDEPRDLEHLYVLLHETMHDTIYDRVGTKAKFFPRELTPVVSAKMFAPEIADTSVPRRVCVLVGPWCIGKTTILLQIAAEAEKKGFVPLYIDFEASTEFPRTAVFVASFMAYVVRNKCPEKCMLFLDEVVWKLQGWESVLKEVAENFRVPCAVASSTFTTERLLVTKTMADRNILYHVSPLFFSECATRTVLLGRDEDIPLFLSLRSLLLQPQLPEWAPVELNATVLADGRMQWVVSTNRVVWNRRTGASTVLSEWSRVPRDDCKDVQGLAGAIGRCCRLREYYTVLQSLRRTLESSADLHDK